ncbi:MAG: hypothetical protein WAU39_18270 [Polyangiales bacterium]
MDALNQTLQRKLCAGRLVRLHRCGASSVEDRLGAPERLWVDERLEVASRLNAPLVDADDAHVERVSQHAVQDLLVDVEPACLRARNQG